MKSASLTHIGNVRSVNQDAFVLREFGGGCVLAVVCDGMGGMPHGEDASHICIGEFTGCFEKHWKDDLSSDEISEILLKSTESANRAVCEKAADDSQYYGMGTTLVAAYITPGWIYIINIGDSRAYTIDELQPTAGNEENSDEKHYKIEQQTIDHSLVQVMIELGEITAEQAHEHPKRSVITRAIGIRRDVQPDFFKIKCKDGMYVLLCSDGLTKDGSDEDILKIITENGSDVEVAAEQLLNYALFDCGGKDNITITLTKIQA